MRSSSILDAVLTWTAVVETTASILTAIPETGSMSGVPVSGGGWIVSRDTRTRRNERTKSIVEGSNSCGRLANEIRGGLEYSIINTSQISK